MTLRTPTPRHDDSAASTQQLSQVTTGRPSNQQGSPMMNQRVAVALLLASLPSCEAWSVMSRSTKVHHARRSDSFSPSRLYSTVDGNEDTESPPLDVSAVEIVEETPSDIDPVPTEATAEASNETTEAPNETTGAPPKTKEENLLFLQALGAITGRGEFASTAQKHSAMSTLERLEAQSPTDTPTRSSPHTLAGTWELVYCSTQLFRSSPFFMAGRAVCTTDAAARQYDWFCDMHRAALAMSSIEAVRQIVNVETGRLVSEFEVRAGAIPFLSDWTPFRYSGGVPIAFTGALVSSADISRTPDGRGWEVYMDTVQVKGSNIPGLRQVLDAESVRLQSRSLANVLEQTIATYTTPKPIFRTTYLDDMYRVSRDQDDNAFLYVKTSSSTEPTDYRKIDADLGMARLLGGFNDAVTRFYI